MKIGLAQMDIAWEDITRNKKKAKIFFEKAVEEKADILVFPEMTLTGFSMNVSKTTKSSEFQLGFFRQMSRQYSMAVVCGYPVMAKQDLRTHGTKEVKQDAGIHGTKEVRQDILKQAVCENHLAIIDQGEVLMDYAKLHPFSFGEESKYFCGGERIDMTSWKDTILGGFVCYDLRFPEIFQISSDQSEIIFVIANWPKTRVAHWDVLLRARAIENQCYIVGVNRTGSGGGLEYNGRSAIYSPTGERITKLSEQEILLTADIDVNEVKEYRRDFPAKKDRREKLYHSLLGQRI